MSDGLDARGGPSVVDFVGRAAELGRLDRGLTQVAAGRGALVTVQGAAGIGKTALAEEVARRARRLGHAIAWGRCWEAGGAPPLWPWHAVLTDLGASDAAALLDGDVGSSSVDPERFARFVAVTDALAGSVGSAGACLIIDDAHHADTGALLLTRFVARSLDRIPLLLVVLRRVGEGDTGAVQSLLEELDAEGDAIVLHHLGSAEIRDLLTQQGLVDLDDELVTAIERITGGNPLFLRRLTSIGAPSSTAGLPHGVRRAVADAIDRLERPDQDRLRLAAVLGVSPSVAETAELIGLAPGAVLDTVARAQTVGLVDHVGRGRFSFSHDLVREVLVDGLSASDLLDAHARAVEVVGGSADEPLASRLARRAHHATRAATRSTIDAAQAVGVARAAAQAMVRGYTYEQAADLLATASRIHADARLYGGAALHVEEAQAVLQAGRLAEARSLFDRAAAGAEDEREPILLAEAALGLGGVWVNEHRTPVEWRRVRALQKRALAGLPAGEDALASRLRTRLAAEAVYVGESTEHVLECLADARRLGDPLARAEALSLTHHVLLTPEHTRDRLALADELVAVASSAGLGVLALMGLCWRTVDLFQLADPAAERALAELRERTDAVGCRSIRYIVSVLDVMLTVRAGRLGEAEDAAAEAFALGTEVGDADALAYFGARLVAVRWLQGRDAEALELVTEVTSSPSLIDAELTFPALEAVFAARTGDPERARAALDRAVAPGLAAIPRSSTWLSGMLAVVEAADALGDAKLAGAAARELVPYADLPILPSLAIVCLGSVERPLGIAARLAGDLDAAVDHLERAIDANLSLGNRPVTALCRAEAALARVERGRSEDRDGAHSLLAEAIAEAEAMGMDAWVARWRDRAAAMSKRPSAKPGSDGPATEAVLRRVGGHWEVGAASRLVVVPDMVGMGYLARLVAQPGVEIPAVTLASGGVQVPSTGRQEVLDEQARLAYGDRARDLADELQRARADGDLARVERLELEVDALAGELERATGLSGRRRTFAGADERARTAVRKAIKRAVDEIAATGDPLADHLRSSVRTGTACCYEPDHEVSWTLA